MKVAHYSIPNPQRDGLQQTTPDMLMHIEGFKITNIHLEYKITRYFFSKSKA